MEILEAFDLVGTLRGAAELAGLRPQDGRALRAPARAAGGGLPVPGRPLPAGRSVRGEDRGVGGALARQDPRRQGPRAAGRDGLPGLGAHDAAGGRRGQAAWRAGHGRSTRPWIPEPGLWMQWDYGEGPMSAGGRRCSSAPGWPGAATGSCCRLVDRTLPIVVMALDRALRAFGGAPTYALTDNERTVTVDHVCGIAVRNPQIVAAVAPLRADESRPACRPTRESKGGSEATVRIAKADLVPTEHNLRAGYASFAELEQACAEFCERVNAREHRVTRPRAGGDAARGARAPAPAARRAAHALLRADAQGVLAVDDLRRRRALLGPRTSSSTSGSGRAPTDERARRRPRRRARRPARGRPPRADHARAAAHPRRALPAPPGRRARAPPPGAPAPRRRPSSRSGPGAERWLIAAAAAGASEVAAQARRGGRARQAARRRARSTGARGRRRRRPLRRGRPRRDPRAPASGAEVIEFPRRDPRRRRCSARPPPGRASGDDRQDAAAAAAPAELDPLLRRLRLPYIRKAAPEVIATAASQRWEPAEVLRVLLAEEAARPRPGDDPDAPPRLRAARRQDLRRLGRRRLRDPGGDPAGAPHAGMGRARARTSASAGPAAPARATSSRRSGTSRSTTARPSPGTPWSRSTALLRRHRADDSVAKAIGRLIRADLIVIDDVGMLPVSPDAAEALFRVVDAAYEKRSLALTSNIHPAGFDELMPKTLAAATVDRLLHHAHVLVTDGTDSYRLAQATAGKGVMPLS